MLPPYPQELNASDIERLVENQVEESLVLDYKQGLPSKEDKDVREFLYDVASFANAQGGDIVYGISDKRDKNKQSTGLPEKILGLDTVNLTTDRSRLESTIRDGIVPPVEARFDTIETSQGPILILRIPKSWEAPHMVTRERINKFYLRSNSGKELMNIDQIRSSFLRGRDLSDRIRTWRNHRLDLIDAGDAPVQLHSRTVFVAHAISASFFSEGGPLKSWVISKQARERIYMPAQYSGNYPTYNADGFLQHTHVGRAADGDGRMRDGAEAYVQIFRSGAIEYASAGITFPHYSGNQQIQENQHRTYFLNMAGAEQFLFRCFDNALSARSTFGITAPAYFAVSLLNWKGTRPYVSRNSVVYSHEIRPIQNERFLVPEIPLEGPPEGSPYPPALKSIADTIAQVCGFEASPYTDTDGTWLSLDHERRRQ
jgi:hypothetical protein